MVGDNGVGYPESANEVFPHEFPRRVASDLLYGLGLDPPCELIDGYIEVFFLSSNIRERT